MNREDWDNEYAKKYFNNLDIEECVPLCGGKYTFYRLKGDVTLYCDRYGEKWRDFIGDGAISALFNHVIDLYEKI